MPLKLPSDDDLAARAWARWILSRPIAILDSETTGLDYDSEIIEIAAIDREGKILLDSYVRPTIPVPFDSTCIHGITDQMVSDAPEWVHIAPIVLNIFRDYQVLIYNAGYDIPRIEYMNKLHKVEHGQLNADCVMLNYAPVYGNWSDYFNSYKWARLDAAVPDEFDNPCPAHSALGDCLATLAVLYDMADMQYQWHDPTAHLFMRVRL